MPSVKGVEGYVARTYKAQQRARKELLDYVRVNLADEEFSRLPVVMARVSELTKILMNLSADLGSMRRLLGDLKMEEGLSLPPG